MVIALLIAVILLLVIIVAYLEGKFREMNDRFDELETLFCEFLEGGGTPSSQYIDESPAEEMEKKIKNIYS